jgi:hypothetical protein
MHTPMPGPSDFRLRGADNCAPSLIGVQLHEQHGRRVWDRPFWGSGTAKIIWDSIKWVALDQLQAGLPYTILGFNKQRPITMLKLQSIKTGEFTWFVDTHLAVNIPNEEAIRQQQMKQAIALIEHRPDHERVVFLATSTLCQ